MIIRVNWRRSIVGLVVVATAFATTEPLVAEDKFPLSDLLPAGQLEIEFLVVAVPKRAEELGLRLQAGIAENRKWYAEFIKQHLASGGGPFQYHPNFGLSKSEFKELLSLGGTGTLRSRGINKRLDVSIDGAAATLSTPGWDDLPGLDTVSVDLSSGECEVYGKLIGAASWNEITTGGGIYGPWRGYSWDWTQGDPKGMLEMSLDKEWERIELEVVVPYGSKHVHFRLRRRGVTRGAFRDEHILFRYRLSKLVEAADLSGQYAPAHAEARFHF